jgi:hypothetical protein
VADRSNYDAAMIRLSTLLLLAVVGVALLAGCGGKSSANTTTVSSTPTVPTGDTGPKPTAKQEVASCQRTVEKIKSLPEATKARLRTSCEKIGGGEAVKKQIAREVCLELALTLPSAEARARAQRICSAP